MNVSREHTTAVQTVIVATRSVRTAVLANQATVAMASTALISMNAWKTVTVAMVMQHVTTPTATTHARVTSVFPAMDGHARTLTNAKLQKLAVYLASASVVCAVLKQRATIRSEALNVRATEGFPGMDKHAWISMNVFSLLVTTTLLVKTRTVPLSALAWSDSLATV